MSTKKDTHKFTPEEMVEFLAKHGTHITIDEAAKALEYLKFLAKLSLEQMRDNIKRESRK